MRRTTERCSDGLNVGIKMFQNARTSLMREKTYTAISEGANWEQPPNTSRICHKPENRIINVKEDVRIQKPVLYHHRLVYGNALMQGCFSDQGDSPAELFDFVSTDNLDDAGPYACEGAQRTQTGSQSPQWQQGRPS